MKEEGIHGANLIAMNTDAQHLARTLADRILIGRQRTRGLGAGSIPQIGEEVALENEQGYKENCVRQRHGLHHGRTRDGTGAAPIVAKAARDEGALTIAVVTLPFTAGVGRSGWKMLEAGLERLRDVADTVIVVLNEIRLLEVVPRLPLYAAFKVADEVLMRAVKGITELITMPGLVNLDFADVRTVMERGGVAMIGVGESDSEDKAADSVKKAIRSPLLDVDISGCHRCARERDWRA